MTYRRLRSPQAHIIAGSMESRILQTREGDDILGLDEVVLNNPELADKLSKPNRTSLLHDVIYEYLFAEWDYDRRKADEYFIQLVTPIVQAYGITLEKNHSDFDGVRANDNYNMYLFDQVKKTFTDQANEVFRLLFSNRILMRTFGEFIAELPLNISDEKHPIQILKNGGCKRCRWPSWIYDALFDRENGKCAICSTDLTKVYNSAKKPHVDHIVPLSGGGSNDPTNLQLLCDTCNIKKGNRSNQSSDIHRCPF